MASTSLTMCKYFSRGADANKPANSDDIEMKTNLVDNKGEPNYGEETGP